MTNWQPIKTAPRDGTKIWGWLYDEGVHLIHWMSAQDNADEENDSESPEDYIACWVKSCDMSDGDWSPPFWLPYEAVSEPPGVVFVNDGRNGRWRDVRKIEAA